MDKSSITKKQSIEILINAIHVGQKRGAWNLQEATTLKQAIDVAQTIISDNPNKPTPSMTTKRLSPSKPPKVAKLPSLPSIKEEEEENEKETGTKNISKLKKSKISLDMKKLQESIRKNNISYHQPNPQILGLEGPIGSEKDFLISPDQKRSDES